MSEMKQSLIRSAVGLLLFSIVTAGVISVTEYLSRDRIAAQRQAAEQRTLNEIIQSEHYQDVRFEETAVPAPIEKMLNSKENAVKVISQGETKALILHAVAPDGYSGEIHLLIGLRANGDIIGVRVTENKETPGLGDRIELKKSPWILSFNNKHVDQANLNRWAVKKDGGEFDQFTGATITPRAVVNQVKRSLLVLQQQPDWFKEVFTHGQ